MGADPGSPAVHVLRDRGVGDGLSRGLQAGLAAQAAAVATEAAELPPGRVVSGDASGLGVERVVAVDVIIVSVPRTTHRTESAVRAEARRQRDPGLLPSLCSQDSLATWVPFRFLCPVSLRSLHQFPTSCPPPPGSPLC